jgi:hypothetical protein
MADFCTIMTVVPTAGIDWSPPLGSGATDLWGLALADAVDPALLVAVPTAVADDAGAVDGTAPDEPLLASGALDPDEPPHAASSSTSDPIPVAAVHPLLRIRVSHSQGWPGPAEPVRTPGRAGYKTHPGRHAVRPGSAGTSGAMLSR